MRCIIKSIWNPITKKVIHCRKMAQKTPPLNEQTHERFPSPCDQVQVQNSSSPPKEDHCFLSWLLPAQLFTYLIFFHEHAIPLRCPFSKFPAFLQASFLSWSSILFPGNGFGYTLLTWNFLWKQQAHLCSLGISIPCQAALRHHWPCQSWDQWTLLSLNLYSRVLVFLILQCQTAVSAVSKHKMLALL